MRQSGHHFLKHIQRKWQAMQYGSLVLYILAIGFICFGFGLPASVISGLGLLVLCIGLWLQKPWRTTMSFVSRRMDAEFPELEHSSALLLESNTILSPIAQLQNQKIRERIVNTPSNILPRKQLLWAILIASMAGALGWALRHSDWLPSQNSTTTLPKMSPVFHPVDSLKNDSPTPILQEQHIKITYPSYTRTSSRIVEAMEVQVLEGSTLQWNLSFDQELDSCFLVFPDHSLPMTSNQGLISARITVDHSTFYHMEYRSKDGVRFSSPLYGITSVPDEAPKLTVNGLDAFQSFDYNERKQLDFTINAMDDYGLGNASIVATVSKGSGESVKFREEHLAFDTPLAVGTKRATLSKRILLDSLDMGLGDELYFYMEISDRKRPDPNTTRSETFFAVIKDTVSDFFEVEATMGVDLMPDYFRSQRQLIIDTEKLIRNKSKLALQEFNQTSNELGYDQKSLRLKYGQFMGDEADSGIQISETESEDTEDLLAQVTHDHDGDDEHDHSHESHASENEAHQEHNHEGHGHDGEEGEEDPLAHLVHNHDDPEEATLFTQSLKSKLRQAMDAMWDAELHLRLFTPEASLPFQYTALNLLQEIKNTARIYVHRIGFDPPPIKEDKRLSGELDAIGNYTKADTFDQESGFAQIKLAVQRLEVLAENNMPITEADRNLFGGVGSEVAQLALASPGLYLQTLQLLKEIRESEQPSPVQYRKLQKDLSALLPPSSPNPNRTRQQRTPMNQLFLQSLEQDD